MGAVADDAVTETLSGYCVRGKLRARSHRRFAPPLSHFISDSLTYSVSPFLKRRCNRTLGKPRKGAAVLAYFGTPPSGTVRRDTLLVRPFLLVAVAGSGDLSADPVAHNKDPVARNKDPVAHRLQRSNRCGGVSPSCAAPQTWNEVGRYCMDVAAKLPKSALTEWKAAPGISHLPPSPLYISLVIFHAKKQGACGNSIQSKQGHHRGDGYTALG
jgi:hypothetical protein